MATITSNHIYDPYDQWFTLDYTFSNGVFTWSVTSYSASAPYRTNIYGLTVNIGGNSYYRGDIGYNDYTPGSVIYSGSTPLTQCTVNNGTVALSVSGNYYYGTWNTSYRASGSGTQAIVPPVVATPTYTITNGYSGSIVGGMSSLNFTMSATPGSSGTTITGYRLYIDGVQAYSGAAATCTVTAPISAGSHTAYAVAIESNGAMGTSSSITITVVAYVPPSLTSVTSIRWSTGNNSGVPADDGTYARLSAVYESATIGGSAIATSCKITVSSYTGTINTSGNVLYSGSILSADQSYNVKYELYDVYNTTPIVRYDTISIGGRALDFVHDSSLGYGIGINTKAVAGETRIKGKLVFEANCLWHSSATSLGATTISLDLSGYSHVIIGGYAWGDSGYFECLCDVGGSGILFYGGYSTASTSSVQNFLNFTWRTVSATASSVTFGNGQMSYAGGLYQNWSNRAVPMWIWGIKKATSV